MCSTSVSLFRVPTVLVAMVLLASPVFATTFTFTQNVSNLWVDADNWTPYYPGLVIQASDSVVILPLKSCHVQNTTVKNFGTVYIGGVSNGGFLFVFSTAKFINHGELIVSDNAFFSLCGEFNNTGYLEINHFSDMGCSNSSNPLGYSGFLRNSGEILINTFFDNWGYLLNEPEGLITTTATATLYTTRTFHNKGTYYNLGIYSDNGYACCNPPPMINQGLFQNEGVASFSIGMDNYGTFVNNGTMGANGSLPEQVVNHGEYYNYGNVTGNNPIFVHDGILLQNDGSIARLVHRSGPIYGTGVFENNLENRGAIFPGGPSNCGTLTLQGTFSTKRRTLAVDLHPSDQSDLLLIAGEATLGGILKVSANSPNDFVPGDWFTILESNQLNAEFPTFLQVEWPTFGEWEVLYNFPEGGAVSVQYLGEQPNLEGRQLAEQAWPELAFPNPADQMIVVPVARFSGEKLWLGLFDVHGKLVIQQIVPTEQEQVQLSTSSLAPGVYQLILIDQKQRFTQSVAIYR